MQKVFPLLIILIIIFSILSPCYDAGEIDWTEDAVDFINKHVNCKFNCPTFLSVVLVLLLGFLPLGGEKFLENFWQFYAAAISFAVL